MDKSMNWWIYECMLGFWIGLDCYSIELGVEVGIEYNANAMDGKHNGGGGSVAGARMD